MKKLCSSCRRTKQASSFYAHPKKSLGLQDKCKECSKRYQRERIKNPETRAQVLETARRTKMKLAYGITLEQYEAKFGAQKGLCAICQKPPTRKRLAVDHDHRSGKIRDLLCSYCNFLVGTLEEGKLVTTAMLYLKHHSS